jgi:hypothetical protein
MPWLQVGHTYIWGMHPLYAPLYAHTHPLYAPLLSSEAEIDALIHSSHILLSYTIQAEIDAFIDKNFADAGYVVGAHVRAGHPMIGELY